MKVIAMLALLLVSAAAGLKDTLEGHLKFTVSKTSADKVIAAFAADATNSFCLSEALARAIASSLADVDAEMLLITGISKLPSDGNRRLGGLRPLAAARLLKAETSLRIDYTIVLPEEHSRGEVQKSIVGLSVEKDELMSSVNKELNEISGLAEIRIKGMVDPEAPVPKTTTSKTTTTTKIPAAEDDLSNSDDGSNDGYMTGVATSCTINHLILSGLALLTAFIQL
eukprot:gnl/TRDRNA2_/TRDRNA2_175861_c0_seq1.p1 gnl/TRDRNA2_/TRDRNA2_175861_c0~~gnl/TRDRNA2_/TRDRNA2_175861_c0_seq1.p1  ORF type:complete len:226 (+),score=50.42 gnl/TRDRNA2_/TRDRNA2_175861_c0_seq1:71-748(+)